MNRMSIRILVHSGPRRPRGAQSLLRPLPMNMGARAAFPARGRSLETIRPAIQAAALAMILFLQACATENVTEVVVMSVTILPPNPAVMEGETLTLDAVVADEGGASIDGAAVLWSSNDPDVVTVDETGVARAISDGVATVAATFRDVTGSATVTVFPGPTLVLEPETGSLSGSTGATPPSPVVIIVENGGMGALGRLTVDVEHDSEGPDGWLTAELAADATPTTLTLRAETDDMGSGVYEAAVVVTSGDTGVESVRLPVRLTLVGLTIDESGSSTSVREGGAMDAFTVTLDLAPEDDIVLSVSSEDEDQLTVSPSRLTFTEADWDAPRSVSVRSVDNDVVDGERSIDVRISIEEAARTAYADMEDQMVEVMVRDDDEADFQVSESDVGTVAREGGPTDTVTVVLRAAPLSDVVFSVRTDDPDDASVEPTRLTFTPRNWNEPRRVIFTAVDDTAVDGVGFRTITIAVDPDESDEAFHGLSRTIEAITFDNDLFGASESGPGG